MATRAPRAPSAPKRPVGRPRGSTKATEQRAIEAPKPGVSPPRVNAPNFGEWHGYIANFAIKWIARAYIAFVFRGIDRYEILSPQDNLALEMDEKQLSDIAKPLAHIAERSKFASKHGRVIIDSSDGVLAGIQLIMWANRVSRIAKKYRPEGQKHEHRVVPGNVVSGEQDGGNISEGATPQHEYNGNAPRGFGYN